MRILHVWDQAGVAGILAKYQRKLGHEAVVIKRAGHDPYGFSSVYGYKLIECSPLRFYLHAAREAGGYDIVHVHSLYKLIPCLKLRGKPAVLHFHGSEVRGRRHSPLVELAVKLADHVLVSTPDLLSLLPEAEWLPNPVDTELFHPNVKPLEGYEGQGTRPDHLPYKLMPNYLKSLSAYLQLQSKYRSLNKTSLEALAVGTPVIWNGLRIMPPLPDIHKPEKVARRTIEIYERVLGRSTA